jgi:hypothetical protein
MALCFYFLNSQDVVILLFELLCLNDRDPLCAVILPWCLNNHCLEDLRAVISIGLLVTTLTLFPDSTYMLATSLIKTFPTPTPWQSGKTTSLCIFLMFLLLGCGKCITLQKPAKTSFTVAMNIFATTLWLWLK